jgi:hypothetical protein
VSVLLTAPTPAEFFATHLAARQARHDEGPEDVPREWRTVAELLADDAEVLRKAHAAMTEAGDPPRAVANYLVGWVGGFLGEAVAFVLATAGAGVLAGPSTRWRFHPDGWPDRVDVSSCPVVVPPGHPWAGLDGVRVVGSEAEVDRQVADALVDILTPYVEACRTLARIGGASLWAEVADGIGAATATTPELEALGPTIPRVQALLHIPGVPWRTRPALWCAEGGRGRMVVVQKGGCCLAYTATVEDDADPPEDATQPVDAAQDPEHRAYQQRFPHVPGAPYYCSTCRFRDRADVEARQVFWSDLLAARKARLRAGPILDEPA